jgi:hypothetical protein
MTVWDNRAELEKLTKEQLIDLCQAYGRLALALDGLWFLGVESAHGQPEAIRIDTDAWRAYGRVEARRLKRVFGLEGRTLSLEEVTRLALLTPVFGILGLEARIEDGRALWTATDCHPQKARIRKGLGEFPCKPVGMAYYETFLDELNPDLECRCVFCPPDDHPTDRWCEWLVQKSTA